MLIHIIKDEFYTSLPPERVLSQIKMRLPSHVLRADSEFSGYVTEGRFKIRRNLHYDMPPFVHFRNSFAPVAEGTVIENENGSTVQLKLRMNILVAAFMLFIEICLILSAIVGLLSCIFVGFGDGVMSLFFGVALFFGAEMLLHLAFSLPAKRLIARIEEILNY